MGQNSVKNCSIVPKTELDLDNLFSMCNLWEEKERKLQI